MKSAAKSNGTIASLVKYQPLFPGNNESFAGPKLSVQQALSKWYAIMNNRAGNPAQDYNIFPDLFEEDLCKSLATDVELIPSLLMGEFISSNFTFDKEQYIRLIQALLTNISDEVFVKLNHNNTPCESIENTLNFLQNFFYHYFDTNSRITKFRFSQFTSSSKLKLDYLQLKLNNSKLIQVFQQVVSQQSALQDISITCHQLFYLQNIIQEIETGLVFISENTLRDLFFYHNFNSACFIEYELELLKTEMQSIPIHADKVSFLQGRLVLVSQLKLKAGTSFDSKELSAKKQIIEWINVEIKNIELKERNACGIDIQITPESKIQTTLSVAKLAVLIRLLVVDKIIINPTIAPMLKTVSKFFTTLQKDEISFGSLETKYHAPDKATLKTMKEIMEKWMNILGKL